MVTIDILEGNKLIAEFMGLKNKCKTEHPHVFPDGVWIHENGNGGATIHYDSSWDWLMPVIDKINDMGKEYHFAIFKTYYSMSVEKSNKVYKDFSFAHSEIKYKGKEIEGAYKLVVKFVQWYNQNKI